MDNNENLLLAFGAKIVENNFQKICNSFQIIGKDALSKSKIGSGEAFINYLDAAIQKYSKIINILYKQEPVYIYDFYVNVDLQCNEKIISTDNVSNFLEENKFTVITAIGGGGKSTLLKHLFLNSIQTTNKIPIYVELRDLNNNSYTLKDCIYNTLTNMKFNLEEKYFLAALDSGCFIFFFDAFDEIQESKKSVIAKEILDMSDKFDINYFIVSSRLSDRFIGWNKFTEMNVQPLNQHKAIELIKKIKYDIDVKQKFIIELEGELYKKHESFASNPLLLTIMLMTFDQYAKIPDKIHIFYQQAFETLYSRHDATKGVFSREMVTDLASDDFVRILSTFCAISYIEDKTSFDNEELFEYLRIAKEIETIEFLVEDYKKDLIEAVCILVQDGLNYTFSHRSFQEYFTAKFISSLTDEEQKVFLYKIFNEKSSSIDEDTVLDMLFDIKREGLERNFLIPILRELKDKTHADNKYDEYFKYLKLGYNSMGIEVDDDNINDSSDSTEHLFYVVSRKGYKYINIVMFINRKYGDYPNPEMPYLVEEDFDRINNFRKFCSNGEQINLNKIVKGSELFECMMKISYFRFKSYEYALSILDVLEKNNKDRKAARDYIFKIKQNRKKA